MTIHSSLRAKATRNIWKNDRNSENRNPNLTWTSCFTFGIRFAIILVQTVIEDSSWEKFYHNITYISATKYRVLLLSETRTDLTASLKLSWWYFINSANLSDLNYSANGFKQNQGNANYEIYYIKPWSINV